VYPTGVAIETAINAYKASPNDPHQPTSMPIYQTSTFVQPSSNELQEYDYTRSANPTRTALEILVSGMEGSDRAFAFTSGMSALACMTRLLKAGDEILCNADIYGGMYRILSKITTRQGVSVKFVKSWELDEVRPHQRSGGAIGGGRYRFAGSRGCERADFDLLICSLLSSRQSAGCLQMSASTSTPNDHPSRLRSPYASASPSRSPHDASRVTPPATPVRRAPDHASYFTSPTLPHAPGSIKDGPITMQTYSPTSVDSSEGFPVLSPSGLVPSRCRICLELCYQFYHYRFYQLGTDTSCYRIYQFRASANPSNTVCALFRRQSWDSR